MRQYNIYWTLTVCKTRCHALLIHPWLHPHQDSSRATTPARVMDALTCSQWLDQGCLEDWDLNSREVAGPVLEMRLRKWESLPISTLWLRSVWPLSRAQLVPQILLRSTYDMHRILCLLLEAFGDELSLIPEKALSVRACLPSSCYRTGYRKPILTAGTLTCIISHMHWEKGVLCHHPSSPGARAILNIGSKVKDWKELSLADQEKTI